MKSRKYKRRLWMGIFLWILAQPFAVWGQEQEIHEEKVYAATETAEESPEKEGLTILLRPEKTEGEPDPDLREMVRAQIREQLCMQQDPTEEEEALLERLCGCVRWSYAYSEELLPPGEDRPMGESPIFLSFDEDEEYLFLGYPLQETDAEGVRETSLEDAGEKEPVVTEETGPTQEGTEEDTVSQPMEASMEDEEHREKTEEEEEIRSYLTTRERKREDIKEEENVEKEPGEEDPLPSEEDSATKEEVSSAKGDAETEAECTDSQSNVTVPDGGKDRNASAEPPARPMRAGSTAPLLSSEIALPMPTEETPPVSIMIGEASAQITVPLAAPASDAVTERREKSLQGRDPHATLTRLGTEETVILPESIRTALAEPAADAAKIDWASVLPPLPQNDGVYTVRTERINAQGVKEERENRISINRFGSVYLFPQNIRSIRNQLVRQITEDLIITELNPDRLRQTAETVEIFRDGVSLSDPVFTIRAVSNRDRTGAFRGWYCYEIRIGAENFQEDGRYRLLLSSRDVNGQESELHAENGGEIVFSVDGTRPSLLSWKETAEEEGYHVTCEIFDAMGLAEVCLYADGKQKNRQTVFADPYRAALSCSLDPGDQQIRLVARDLAGNERIEERLVKVPPSAGTELPKKGRGAFILLMGFCVGAAVFFGIGTIFLERRAQRRWR